MAGDDVDTAVAGVDGQSEGQPWLPGRATRGTEQACRAATAALVDLPPGWRTGLTRTRAVELYRMIPAQAHREPAARELRDALAV